MNDKKEMIKYTVLVAFGLVFGGGGVGVATIGGSSPERDSLLIVKEKVRVLELEKEALKSKQAEVERKTNTLEIKQEYISNTVTKIESLLEQLVRNPNANM